jgi:putative membrane protein
MMWWNGGAGHASVMAVWWLIGLSLTVLAIVAIVWVVRSLSPPPADGRGGPRPRSAREELDSRYARGEIGRDEYQRIRQDLAAGDRSRV